MVCTIFCAEILTLLICEQQMSRDRVVMKWLGVSLRRSADTGRTNIHQASASTRQIAPIALLIA